MAKSKRYMDTTKGYNRAAHKAATMAVVEEDFYEELHDPASGAELFRVSDDERSVATARSADSRQHQMSQNGHVGHGETGPEDKKPGLLGRLFGALRRLG